MNYWFNVSTRMVETDDDRSPASEVLGPFPSRELAEQALEISHRRTKIADEEDARWDEPDE